MNNVYINMFITTLLIRVRFVNSFAEIDYTEDKDFQHCVCVPYWQCKEDYSGLIEDGIDIIDIRDLRTNEGKKIKAIPCMGDFDVCCQVECGRKRSIGSEITVSRQLPISGNVFGFRLLGENNEANFAEFPWMLGILEDHKYRCGASLIHPQVALTAAHCVTGTGPFTIRAGEWNWAKSLEPLPHQDQIAIKVIIHPQYHSPSLRNDIALLILGKPFKLTENVGLVCLSFQEGHIDRKKCIVTGWGKNSHKKGTYQSVLKKMELPLVPKEKCLRSLQEAKLGPFFNLHKSFICAGGEMNKDTCKGDGGSPLICPVTGQLGKYTQVGIVSWGLTCGIQSTPGVYVNSGLFRDWIDEVLEAHGLNSNVYKY